MFINARPFVLREIDQPFQNLADFEGIDSKRLDRIENVLKQDILREAETNLWNILVHDERYGDLRPNWESANKYCVQTTAEVVKQLQNEGYNLTFQRLPVTAETSFPSDTVDNILTMTRRAHEDENMALIFNCQMGRGRSTIAMNYSYLAFKKLMAESLTQDSELTVAANEEKLEDTHDPDARLVEGNYDIILKLMRILPKGKVETNKTQLKFKTLTIYLKL